jgi:hypothetical protein
LLILQKEPNFSQFIQWFAKARKLRWTTHDENPYSRVSDRKDAVAEQIGCRAATRSSTSMNTVSPVAHLQLPGIATDPEVVDLRRSAARQGNVIWVTAAARKPWSTPTLTEIPFDSLPDELRMLALGLSAQTAGGDFSDSRDWPATH